jgi:hypothetical protein
MYIISWCHLDGAVEARRYVVHDGLRDRELVGDAMGEGLAPAERSEHHGAQAPEIGGGGDALAGALLGRHPVARA